MLKENFNLVDKNAYQPGGIYINVCRRKKIYKDKTSSYGIWGKRDQADRLTNMQ